MAALVARGHDGQEGPTGELLVMETEIAEAPPVAASFYMRCCASWEEDENAVDFKTYDEVGYLHWSRAECRT